MKKDINYYTALYARLSGVEVLPITDNFDYTFFQIQQYNSISGGSSHGYVCPHCKNKNYIATLNNSGDFALIPCYHGGK